MTDIKRLRELEAKLTLAPWSGDHLIAELSSIFPALLDELEAARKVVEASADVWAKVLKVMVDVDNPERGGEQCAICGDDYTTDHGKDDTGFCHDCASSTLDDLVNSARAFHAAAGKGGGAHGS